MPQSKKFPGPTALEHAIALLSAEGFDKPAKAAHEQCKKIWVHLDCYGEPAEELVGSSFAPTKEEILSVMQKALNEAKSYPAIEKAMEDLYAEKKEE